MTGLPTIKASLNINEAAEILFDQVQLLRQNQDQVVLDLGLHPDCGDCLEVACAMGLILRERAEQLEHCRGNENELAYIASQIEVSALVRVYGEGVKTDLVHASVSFGDSFIGLDRYLDDLYELVEEKSIQDDKKELFDRYYEIRTHSIDDLIQLSGQPLIEEFAGFKKNHNGHLDVIDWDRVLDLKDRLVGIEADLSDSSTLAHAN